MCGMQHPEWYAPCLAFLASIGLPVCEGEVPADAFLPGIAVADGGLRVDPSRLQWPGDLLHEAGHLAVMPAAVRAQAHADVDAGEHAPWAGEQEAMAWALAAAHAIGMPVDVLVHDGGYHGRAQDIRTMYALGIVPGLRGLCASGMAAAGGFGADAGAVQYPAMLRWLRG